jgi:hypothetical protein
MAPHDDLRDIYMKTTYCVETGPGEIIRLRIGQKSAALDELLRRCNAACWAFITAWNPGSMALAPLENERRQEEMAAVLQCQAYRTLPGEGVGETPDWIPERSLLVLGIEREAALAIGRQFGQVAIVWGHRGSVPELLFCTECFHKSTENGG